MQNARLFIRGWSGACSIVKDRVIRAQLFFDIVTDFPGKPDEQINQSYDYTRRDNYSNCL